jgi:hypothetical protein
MITDIIALWKIAPPPAPETPELKRLRLRSMISCLAAALSIASITILVRIHPLAVLVVAALMITAIVQTICYWWVKNAVDTDYAAALAGDDGADEGLQP